MVRMVIDFDPATGALQVQGPTQKPLMVYMLEIAKQALLAPPAREPALAVPDQALTRQLLEDR